MLLSARTILQFNALQTRNLATAVAYTYRPLIQPNVRSYVTKPNEIIGIEKPKTLEMRQLFEKEFNTLKFSDLTQIDTPHKGDVALNGGPTQFFNNAKTGRIYSYNDKHRWASTEYTINDFTRQQSTRFDVTDQVKKMQETIHSIPDVSKMWKSFQKFVQSNQDAGLISGLCLGAFASVGAMLMASPGNAVGVLILGAISMFFGVVGYVSLLEMIMSNNPLVWLVALMIASFGVAAYRDS
jgi:hypothetical protein